MSGDNVRPINAAAEDQDAFEQANASEEGLGSAEKGDDLDLDLELASEEPVRVDEPELIEEPKPKSKPDVVKSGRAPAYIAMGMSAIAIAVSGLSFVSQKGLQAGMDEQIASVEDYVTDLRIKTEGMQSQVAANTSAVKQNTTQLQSISSIRGEMLIYNSALDQMKSDIESMKSTATQGQTLIGEQRTALESLTGRVSKLESRPVKVASKTVRKARPAPRKSPAVDVTKIEGASLSSIDSWGTQTNVMLRGEDGQWIPMSKGDFYKGWQFVSAKADKATFRNGKKTRSIKVEG
tara:strand:+ start:4960 stop:5838 length:879 start_codon:yes stop_codon:yes gene_type:complete